MSCWRKPVTAREFDRDGKLGRQICAWPLLRVLLRVNATIYLPDLNHLGAFNAQWDAWVPDGCAPVRACVSAALADPRLLVEIQLVAAQ